MCAGRQLAWLVILSCCVKVESHVRDAYDVLCTVSGRVSFASDEICFTSLSKSRGAFGIGWPVECGKQMLRICCSHADLSHSHNVTVTVAHAKWNTAANALSAELLI